VNPEPPVTDDSSRCFRIHTQDTVVERVETQFGLLMVRHTWRRIGDDAADMTALETKDRLILVRALL
jgi:hypothetical protein